MPDNHDPRRITLPAPLVAAEITSDLAAIYWTRVESASGYEVELRSPADVHASWMAGGDDVQLPFASSVLPAREHAWHLRVRALTGDDRGAWSVPQRIASEFSTVESEAEAPAGPTAGALMPPPLLQAHYQAGNAVLDFSPVSGATGYSAQLLTQNGKVAAAGTADAGTTTISFSATEHDLQAGSTYLSRVAGTADGSSGRWSTSQPVLIEDLDRPVAVTTFAGGTLYGDVQQPVTGAAFYAFQASLNGEVVDEAFAAAAALPAAFDTLFGDGQTVDITAQAVDGNVLSAWSSPAPITVAVLTPPVLNLSFTSSNITATWSQAGSLTRYEFQLWTVAEPPQLVAQQTIAAAPYQVVVSTGLVEDQVYRGMLRSQEGLNSSAWSTAQVQVSMLDPLLVALYDRFDTAWHSGGGDRLPIDAATLGTPGAAVVTLMQNGIGAAEIVVSSDITLSSNPTADTVTVTGNSQAAILGIVAPPIRAVFSVSNGAIVADITIGTTSGWTLATSFPALERSVVGTLNWSGTPAYILSSLGGVATSSHGALVPGLNLYGSVNLSGPAAGVARLIPTAANPLLITGPVTTNDATFTLQLSATVPDFAFSSLPGLAPLAFTSPQFSVNAQSLERSAETGAVYALWIGANVPVGGVTLPLVVQLAMGVSGWVIMTRPGTSVPVPNLATFFGVVSGASIIIDALPEDVASQKGLQVQVFRVAITSDFANFKSVTMALGSTAGSSSSNPLWSPLPGILELTTLNLCIQCARQGSDLAVSGWINGSALFGETLQLSASISLPVGKGNWTFSATAASSLAGLDAFNSLVGGDSTTFADTLPGGLGDLPEYTLGCLTLVVNPMRPALTLISFQLYSSAQWHIIENQIVVDSISTALRMTNPTLSTRELTGLISGSLLLGEVSIVCSIERVDSSSDWTMNVSSDLIPLPSLGDLANFVGGDGAAALLPDSLATNHFALRNVLVTLNLTEQKLQLIGFTLDSEDTWVIFPPDILTASEVSTSLNLDWSSGDLVTSGNMLGTIGVTSASFAISATYIGGIWTIDADMVAPDGDAESLDFAGSLTQFGISSELLIPSNVGLPTLILTSGSLHLVPSTGEMSVSATSALVWSVPFGTGAKPMSMATLGGTVNKLADGAGWNAKITGALSYDGINGAITVELGGAGIDTIIRASVDNIPAENIPTIADDLAEAPDRSNAWNTIAFPEKFPPLGLDSIGQAKVQLYLNLTQNTFVLFGSSSAFGTAAFVVQETEKGWQSAFGVNLSTDGSKWEFKTISPGLAPADSFFNIDQASGAPSSIDQAAAALAISSIDEQQLETIAAEVPELKEAFPSWVKRGANFYGVLHFSGPKISNVPRILGDELGTTVTLYALISQTSAESLFQVELDHYTLAGVVTFSDVYLRYQPVPSRLKLHGEITIPVDEKKYGFTGDMDIDDKSAQFELEQSSQAIVNPLGMRGIKISGLGVRIDYTFPDDATKTLAIRMKGTTIIGEVANLTGILYVVNGNPVLTAITVEDFDIVNLFMQCIGVGWPSTIVPLRITSGSVYDYRPADLNDKKPLTLDGAVYDIGFNVAAHLEILGVAATRTIAVVPDAGVTATGSLDKPIAWGFIIFSGGTQTVGPSASLATFPTTTYTLVAGFTIFDAYIGVVTFSISRQDDEDVATMTFRKDVGPPFGEITLTVSWSKSRGYYFDHFPLDFPADFKIKDIRIPKLNEKCPGKQILDLLPIKTKYDFDSDFTITDGSLVITFEGYFELTSMLKKDPVLTIKLQTLTVRVPSPTGGKDPFRWSDIPLWIANTIIDNADSIFEQVLDDPKSLAKLLAIKGVQYVASELVKTLECRNPKRWGKKKVDGSGGGETVAAAFVAGAASAFEVTIMVEFGEAEIAVILGGIAVVILANGLTRVGHSGDEAPPTPDKPGSLSLEYTNDTLSMSWGKTSNAGSYAWQLKSANDKAVAQQSNVGGTSASVGKSKLTWGEPYTLNVLGMNDGVLGPDASKSYTIPTPATVAGAQQSSGKPIEEAGTAIRQVFPSVDAVAMGDAIVAAYDAGDPATHATALAISLRNGSYDQSTTDAALPKIFPTITQAQLAAAIQSAYSLDSSQLAQYLVQHGATPQESAQILNGVFALEATTMIDLLAASYSGIDAATLVSSLAAAPYTMQVNAAAVQRAMATDAGDMATYLVASYNATDATPSAVALVLQGIYAETMTPATMLAALLGAFTSPALTPAQAAEALVAAFATPTPITAATVATTLGVGFGYPATIGVTGIAVALAAAFVSITQTEVAQALVGLSPQPSSGDVARALVASFLEPGATPSSVAGALVAAFTTPAPITQVKVGRALVTAFTDPPIDASGAGVALVATFPQITADELAADLVQIFIDISQNAVAVALVASLTAVPAVTMTQVATALISSFGSAATVDSVAIALATAFPAGLPPEAAQALVAAFTATPPTPQQIAVALVAAYTQPAPIDANGVLVALLAVFPALTATEAAQSLVAAFTTPGPITATVVVQQLLGVAFAVAPTPSDIAIALVAAFTSTTPITPAEVAAAMIAGYGVTRPAPSQLAIALVAAFTSPAPITASTVAQTLQAAPFATPLTIPENAVAVAAAFPAINASELTTALFSAYTDPAPRPSDIAGALVAAMPAVTANTIAEVLVASFTTPEPIAPASVASVIVAAMTNPPVAAADVVAALQAAFTAEPAITLSQAAQAIQQAYASSNPITAAALATVLLTGWTPAPSTNDVAIALVAAFPATTATELAQTLLTAIPTATPNDIAAALAAGLTSPAVTAADIATALVAVFLVPEPTTQRQVAQALVFALPQSDATTAGQALVTAFGQAATFASTAIALAAAAFDMAAVSGAINTIFAVTPEDNAIGLAVAFPARPVEVLQTLIAVYTEAVVTPEVGATALYGAFVVPARITPAETAVALVTSYTTPAITAVEVTNALIAGFAPKPLLPSDAAIALVASFTTPAAITAPEVAQTLVATFSGITESDVAIALVAAFVTPSPITAAETLAALQTAFPALTASQAAQSLVAAFTTPVAITYSEVAIVLVAQFTALTWLECVDALQDAYGMVLGPSEAAIALVAAFTSPAVMSDQVVTTLRQAYPSLRSTEATQALVAAFVSPAITANEAAITLVATFSDITDSDVAIALVNTFVSPAISPNEVSLALQAAKPSISIDGTARALRAGFTSPAPIGASAVAIALQQTFSASVATMPAVAAALVAAFTGIDAGNVAAALYAAFTGATPTEVAAALVASMSAGALVVAQALVTAQPSITPAEVMTALMASVTTALDTVAGALAGAFPSDTSAQIAPVLVAGAPTATVNDIAAALVSAYAYTVTEITTLLSALVAGYASSKVAFDAGIASVALQTSLNLSNDDAPELTSAVGNQFQLTRSPNDVAALGVCLNETKIDLSFAVSAMKTFYGSGWSGEDFTRLFSVYSAPEWQLAILGKEDGKTTAQVSQQIITQNPKLAAGQMTLVLASTYFMTYATDLNITQVSLGMKAAIYSLPDATPAMALFYAPDWGTQQDEILRTVYSSP
ncbi:MAG TPA: hypothetical protein VEK11_03965 [Thermoanaerobaculia bacterium]|nr:hypothetical protein [Thermoanaerobaculia bacterium]